jgi:hypothetical protein
MPAHPGSRSQYITSRQNDAPSAHQDAHNGTYALVAFETQIAGYALRFVSMRSLLCAGTFVVGAGACELVPSDLSVV